MGTPSFHPHSIRPCLAFVLYNPGADIVKFIKAIWREVAEALFLIILISLIFAVFYIG